MISDKEMDLLRIQAKNMLIEVNLEHEEMKSEGREDDRLRRNQRLVQGPGEANGIVEGGGGGGGDKEGGGASVLSFPPSG